MLHTLSSLSEASDCFVGSSAECAIWTPSRSPWLQTSHANVCFPSFVCGERSRCRCIKCHFLPLSACWLSTRRTMPVIFCYSSSSGTRWDVLHLFVLEPACLASLLFDWISDQVFRFHVSPLSNVRIEIHLKPINWRECHWIQVIAGSTFLWFHHYLGKRRNVFFIKNRETAEFGADSNKACHYWRLSIGICDVSAERLFNCLWSLNGSQERWRSGRIWTNGHQLFLHASLGSHLKIFNWLMACSQIIRQAEEVFEVLEF